VTDPPVTAEIAGPVRVLSDLHLVHDASRVKRVASLRPLLEGAENVVFNGDTCELVYSGWRQRSEEMRDELVALCGELGATPWFTCGNHDPWISQFGWLTAEGGRVFITHGDLVLRNPSPWNRECLQRKREILALLRDRGEGDGSLRYRWETLQQLNRAMIPESAKAGSSRFNSLILNALCPPERAFQILRVWALQARHADAFVRRFAPDCRAFIYGHFHRPLVAQRGGRFLCNTGAFVAKNESLVVDVAQGVVTAREVDRGAGDFRPGREVGRMEV
jgi:predicted phosphodiesterase